MKWIYLPTDANLDPVTYADVKAQCHIDSDDERTLILNYITAARLFAEAEMGITLIQRQVLVTNYHSEYLGVSYGWLNPHVALPRGPVVSIDAVTDAKGDTVDPTKYELRREGTTDFVHLKGYGWPATITYTAGLGETAADVPADIRTGILLHVAHLWDNRSATSSRPTQHIAMGLDAIYGQYRTRGVIG